MDMADCKSVIPELEGEENLIAAAKHIARALGSNKNLTDDTRRILADLGVQLSSISTYSEKKDENLSEIENCLNDVQEKIASWEADQSMIWDSGSDEVSEYLNAADEARKLTDRLESLSLKNEEYELLGRAHDVLQTAMAMLEEELVYMLVQNKQPFEPEHVSFRSSEEDTLDESSIISFGDDSVEDSILRDSTSRASEEFIIDLVHPHVIPELRCIANLMISSKYERECTQAYTSVRKEALDECIFILAMEKLSIEDVLRMEWVTLNSMIKGWIRAMKIFVRVYLASEKWLSEQIFGDHERINQVCFLEASKASILQLLNFADAMSIGPHKPEKLFRILDMYEVLADLVPDIDTLYLGEAGSSITMEWHEVLGRLGDCVRATFIEFENAIATNHSTNPILGGGIHPLTRYVMNYIRTLTDYGDTLNLLLKDHDDEVHLPFSPDVSPSKENDNKSGGLSNRISPTARHFLSVAAILECNLDAKSKLCKEAALQHIFLMNNIHYMAEKVKGSELRLIFGDEWIRKRNWKFQQHAMNYERASWSSILSLFKDEGLQNPGSNSISKILLKERFRSFYLAFEEIYRTQTGWVIPDLQLREDLRISTSLKVIQAYRTFVGRNATHISDKHIKYSADDMENFLLDLFEGSPKSLQNPCRR
ncbi:exocyst complex component EXO70E2 [Ziziphus jujuba]|uniref:Exocyst subunit Exo70 family protein n=1 Tax=Ziziphus jujuba TaxID=326968 RepID=A0A6P3ZWB6_ZIZJJ|nr:exocyst complex component EXO70E2 [Ziziphus jujuba]